MTREETNVKFWFVWCSSFLFPKLGGSNLQSNMYVMNFFWSADRRTATMEFLRNTWLDLYFRKKKFPRAWRAQDPKKNYNRLLAWPVGWAFEKEVQEFHCICTTVLIPKFWKAGVRGATGITFEINLRTDFTSFLRWASWKNGRRIWLN